MGVKANANEAAVVDAINVIPVENLSEVIQLLEERRPLVPQKYEALPATILGTPDFAEIKGQENAKRALMIAAAGSHNVLMSGPPGVGKSLLAHAMVGILPPMPLRDSIEVTKIWSAAGMGVAGLLT